MYCRLLLLHLSLNSDLVSWAVNWPFLQARTAEGHGGGLGRVVQKLLPTWGDSCSFPPFCPLTVEPCLEPASRKCQCSCNYPVLTSHLWRFLVYPRLSVCSLSPQGECKFISRTFAPLPCLLFTFCRNAGRFKTFSTAEQELQTLWTTCLAMHFYNNL